MPFFTYDQNNSGGGYTRDDEAGIGERVIVEADTAEEANERAERIGLYFDGDGDCDCCGNRWSMTYSNGNREDMPDLTCWGRTGPAFVHYADGRIEKHETPTDEPKPVPTWWSLSPEPAQERRKSGRFMTVGVECSAEDETLVVRAYKSAGMVVELGNTSLSFDTADELDEFIEALRLARTYAFEN